MCDIRWCGSSRDSDGTASSSCHPFKAHPRIGINQLRPAWQTPELGPDHVPSFGHTTRDTLMICEAQENRRSRFVAQITNATVKVMYLASVGNPRQFAADPPITHATVALVAFPDGALQIPLRQFFKLLRRLTLLKPRFWLGLWPKWETHASSLAGM